MITGDFMFMHPELSGRAGTREHTAWAEIPGLAQLVVGMQGWLKRREGPGHGWGAPRGVLGLGKG